MAGAVLLAIGLKSVTHGMSGGDDTVVPPLSTRKLAITAFAVAIDKLAVGLSFAVLEAPKVLLFGIVAAQAFAATLIGLWLGKRLGARAGDVAEAVAELVFTGLGLVVLFKTFTSG